MFYVRGKQQETKCVTRTKSRIIYHKHKVYLFIMWTMQKAFTKLFASDNASPKKMPVVNVSPASPSSPRSVSSNPTSTGKSVASSPGSVISVLSSVNPFKENKSSIGSPKSSSVQSSFFPQRMQKVKSSQSLGVSIAFLQWKFLNLVKDTGLKREEATIEKLDQFRSDEYEHGIFRTAGFKIKSPVDGAMGAAFVHTLKKPDAGPASIYISYSSTTTISDIVTALEFWCMKEGHNPDRTYVWMHCFCSNMARNRTQALSAQTVGSLFHKQLNTFKHCVAILSPWSDPAYLSRVWCLYELFHFGTSKNSQVTIILPPKEMIALCNSLRGDGKDIDHFFNSIKDLRIEQTKSAFETDHSNILHVIRDGPGTTVVNKYIQSTMKNWIRTAILDAVSDEHNFVATDLDFASYLRNVGELLLKCGFSDDSMKMYEKSLTIHENVSGKDSIIVADVYSDMGAVFEKNKDDVAAFLTYHKQLAVLQNTFGDHDPSLAAAYRNIARMLRIAKEFKDASEMLQQALFIEEAKKEGSSYLGLGLTYYEFAMLYFEAGDFELAYDNLQRSIMIRERSLGRDHIDTAKSYISLGEILLSHEHWEEALKLYKKGSSIMIKVLGENHSSLAPVYGKMAMIFQASGDANAALEMYEKQLTIANAGDFESVEELTLTYNNIGLAFYDQKKYNIAMEMHKKALQLQYEKLGPKHPDVILTCKYIAEVYCSQSKPDAAIAILREAIEIEELVNGLFNPSVAESNNYLASILRDNGDIDGALEAFTRGTYILR
jgi:tetratricopeptide (TPR) repeat protein